MKKILFYLGYLSTPLQHDSVYTTGLGGSETAACEIAEQLARDGRFEVMVIGSNVTDGKSEGGVTYTSTSNLRESGDAIRFDVVIAINYIHYLKELDFIEFDQSIFWLHNTEQFPWWKGESLPQDGDELYDDPRMSLVVCVSEWQKQIVVEKHPNIAHKVRVIENGFNRELFSHTMPSFGPTRTFIYTSGPDRGLRQLLTMWPKIREQYPDAILKLFCPQYCAKDFYELCDEMAVQEIPGVLAHGPTNKGLLYREIEQARYWIYPSEYPETFCITALEMMYGKAIVLSTDTGNLRHLLSPKISTFRTVEQPDDQWYDDMESYFLSTIKYVEDKLILKSPNHLTEQLCDIQAYAAQYQWKHVAAKWIDILEPLTVDKLAKIAFVISLKPDTQDNRDRWTNSLHKAGFDGVKLIHFPAVNGNDVDSQYLLSHNLKVYKNWRLDDHPNDWWSRDIKPGELGCAISHLNVWQYAYDQRMSNILVLEDDFIDERPIRQEVLDQVPCDWDMLYLGRNPLTLEPGDPKELVVSPGPSYNMHAYALNRVGIEKLIQQNFDQVLMPVDEFIQGTYATHPREDLSFIWRDMHTYAVRDQVLKQTSDPTTSQTENAGTWVTIPVGPTVSAAPDVIVPTSRKYPELYTFFQNESSWCERFLSPGVLDMEIDLMVDEPISNVYTFRLFTSEFCQMLREEAEYSGQWTTDRHQFYPTTDMLLSQVGFNDIYDTLLRRFVEPVIHHVYQLEGNNWNNMNNENFLARYTVDTQPLLKTHHDSSDITALLNLTQVGRDYTGGGTYFSKYKALHCPDEGVINVHPGCITHRHGARPVLSGSRYIIVSFMKRR